MSDGQRPASGLSTDTLRDKFLQFFASKDHLIYPSSSLVPDDPTTLLTSAGMQPLVPYFKGLDTPPRRRLTTCQKCCRADDIEEVGRTWRHCTFFEMLGNFSFGDYFKQGAIEWGWEFVTEVLGISKEDLWVSVYHEDAEAYDIWAQHVGVPSDRILRFGKKDNWWGPVGDSGPCGPDSEIFIDRGPRFGCGKPDCKPGCDCDRYGELWNLVFQQYDQQVDKSLPLLPAPGIDTGMGLERTAAVLQGKDTIFEADGFWPIISRICEIAAAAGGERCEYGRDRDTDIAMRIVVDHTRAVVFMAQDGIVPSNEGRGYVMRRILRRGYRYGRILGLTEPFLHRLIPTIATVMQQPYPEIGARADALTRVVQTEEQRFQETLEHGLQQLESAIAAASRAGSTVIPGDQAFRLYDTFGFPYELTAEIATERGFTVDREGFEREMSVQRERARSGSEFYRHREQIDFTRFGTTEFLGYGATESPAKVVETLATGEGCLVALDHTPFYGESGGQIGDTGELTGAGFRAKVIDTRKGGSAVLHVVEVESGELKPGLEVTAVVDAARRAGLCRAHTATHLLHAALHRVLGTHATQAGSLVEPDRLRFDFAHFAAVSPEELLEVERIANEQIFHDLEVRTDLTTLDAAKQAGAMALFGEKYGETVRTVRVGDFSLELCGGTHVASTGMIGLCKIVSESSVGANLRRIEALTGPAALEFLQTREQWLKEAAAAVNTSPDRLTEAVHRLQQELKDTEKQLDELRRQAALSQLDALAAGGQLVAGVTVLASALSGADADNLRDAAERLAQQLDPAVVVLGSTADGRVLFACKATAAAVARGAHAGNVLREVSRIAGGGGGGRPDFAQAGGKQPEQLAAALEAVADVVAGQLGSSAS